MCSDESCLKCQQATVVAVQRTAPAGVERYSVRPFSLLSYAETTHNIQYWYLATCCNNFPGASSSSSSASFSTITYLWNKHIFQYFRLGHRTCGDGWSKVPFLSPNSVKALKWQSTTLPVKKTGCWFVGGDDLTGALHDL